MLWQAMWNWVAVHPDNLEVMASESYLFPILKHKKNIKLMLNLINEANDKFNLLNHILLDVYLFLLKKIFDDKNQIYFVYENEENLL